MGGGSLQMKFTGKAHRPEVIVPEPKKDMTFYGKSPAAEAKFSKHLTGAVSRAQQDDSPNTQTYEQKKSYSHIFMMCRLRRKLSDTFKMCWTVSSSS